MRHLRKITVWLMMYLCWGITAEAKESAETIATIDGNRAIVATVIAVAIGIVIFCVRNRRIFKNRGKEWYD